jgi:hypothetical protein
MFLDMPCCFFVCVHVYMHVSNITSCLDKALPSLLFLWWLYRRKGYPRRTWWVHPVKSLALAPFLYRHHPVSWKIQTRSQVVSETQQTNQARMLLTRWVEYFSKTLCVRLISLIYLKSTVCGMKDNSWTCSEIKASILACDTHCHLSLTAIRKKIWCKWIYIRYCKNSWKFSLLSNGYQGLFLWG